MTAGSGRMAGPTGAVHQFVPALIARDATGSHTLLLREALRAAGWRSEIFAEATHDELLTESYYVERYRDLAEPGDVLVYQLSTSSMVGDFLAERPEPLILDYHNITPPDLHAAWDPPSSKRSAEAVEQLRRLAGRSVLGIAPSEFNAADLTAAGCPRTVVVPVLVDFDRLVARPDPRVLGRLTAAKGDGGADWLFVGRMVPSKAQHELVKALWAYRRLYDPKARLHLVGPMQSGRYRAAVQALVTDLGLGEVVHLVGEVSEPALASYYAAADVYVSLSVHEGFGVPLLEAMRAEVPVVALDAGAVRATVSGAGLLLERGEPSYVAAAVHRVVGDRRLASTLVAAGHRRVAAHSLEDAGKKTVAAIASVAGPPPRCKG